MKALVVSGGGSKGAFGGGIIQKLNKNYDLYIGTSTGGLLVPLASIGEYDKLKFNYTNTTQKDIFKVNPFKIKKKSNGEFDVKMSYLRILYNLIFRRKKSFGDSSNLRKRIQDFISESDFNKMKNSNSDILICVTNSNLAKVEYKSIKDCTINEFYDIIWASTSAFPIMDTVKVNGYDYIDGGFTDPSPIQEAINRGAKEIDVIVLKPEDGRLLEEPIKNPLQGLGRVIDIMLKEINNNDIQIATLNAIDSEVLLNIYYTPRLLTNNPLVFDKELMTQWWEEGFNYVDKINAVKYIVKGPNNVNERI